MHREILNEWAVIFQQLVSNYLKLIKVDGETGKPMAGIPFSITSKTTGESHIVVTDKNGIASTWAKHIPHSFKTNENDQYDEQLELEPTGVWFSGSEAVVIADDSRGALPYDDYIIRELPCKANAAYYINKEFEVSIRNDGVYEYGTVTNERLPEIKTKLFDSIDGDKVVSKEGKADISLVDKVTYKYLETGKIYVLKGMIIDKATKKPIKLKNGESEIYVEFDADGEEGVIEVPFEFSFNVKDCELVAFEYLYEKSGKNDNIIT